MGNIQTQVNVQVNVQQVVAPQAPQTPPPPVQPQPAPEAPKFNEDQYTPTLKESVQKAVSNPTNMIKKMAGGLIVGGTASTLAAMAGKGIFTESFHKPTLASVASGAALGLGIGLVNIETGDDTKNLIKNTAGAALIGGGATTMAESVSKAIFTEYLHAPSTSGMLMGAALGGGIALVNNDTGDKTVDNLKNIAGGALIGGSAVGIASAVAKTIGMERLASASPIAAGIGVALGAGIAILNMEE